jgi:predicted anti-sigma-YlaC factor YlaD
MENDKLKELLTAYADGELDEAGRREVEKHLAESEHLRRELESMKKMKSLTSQMQLVQPEEEVWNMYWNHVYNRLERGLGWILLSVGAIILLSFGAFHFVRDFLFDPEPPLIMKIGVSAAILGVIILLVSVLRERLFIRKSERYKEIVR